MKSLESLKGEISKIIEKYPQKRSALVPILLLVQFKDGYLTKDAIREVSTILETPENEIFEVISFYSMLRVVPSSKYVVKICTTLPCMLKEYESLLTVAKKYENDKRFTFIECECLGACTKAPVVHINDELYECLDVKVFADILEKCE